MAKFCKVFENGNNDQLLIFLTINEENRERANINLMLEVDGCQASMVLEETKWKKARKALESYSQDDADKILRDPRNFLLTMLHSI